MTAEQLDIKVKLDLSDLKNGLKQIKTQLEGTKKAIKDSIPQISKEGTTASKSLNDVGKAANNAKKAVSDIGTAASKSLSDVVSQSNKISKSLNDIKSTKGTTLTLDATDATDSINGAEGALGELQATMTAIAGMDFFGLMAQNWDKIKNAVSGMKTLFAENLSFAKNYGSKLREALDALVEARAALKAKADAWKAVNKYQKASTDLQKKWNAGWKQANKYVAGFAKDIARLSGKALASLLGDVMKLVGQFTKLAAIVSTVAVAIGGLALGIAGARIAEQTKQYRQEQAKLVSGFQAAGATAEQASGAYENLFRFLGDSSRSVEAANHLAKLTTNTQHLAEWTTICQGIYATFGDSLPIEGLTEAANETARTAKVTGVLADALNWAGVSEDAMNAALEQATTLQEREAIIRRVLNGLYYNAASIYEQNNSAIIAQNEAQSRLNATMASIGAQTMIVNTSWINLKNTLLSALAPAIIAVSAALSVLIDKIATAIAWIAALFGVSIKMGNAATGITKGTTQAATGISRAADAAGTLKDNLGGASGAAEKLKRIAMGFDELNIVTDPNTSGGGGGGGGGGVEIPELELGEGTGIIDQMNQKVDDIKAKVEEWMEKWKAQIAIIGSSLAVLGIAKLLEHLGKAVGLGDKFMTFIKGVQKLATTAIVITLQYTLVNEFFDKFIDGEGIKNYLLGLLVSAIGTGVLYSMWGPAGAVIGLLVTAVAGIKAVIDNEGITNGESATVMFTSLGAAIAALGIAWKKLGLATMAGEIGAFFALLKEGNSLAAVLGAAFPKAAAAIGKIGSAFSGIISGVKAAVAAIGSFAGSIGSALGLTGGAAIAAGAAIIVAAIAAIAGTIMFVVDNWKALCQAVKDFWKENITPKLESICESFKKMWDAIKSVGEAFAQLGTTIWNALPQGLKDFFAGVAQAIKDVVSAIAEWFASIDWLDAIKTAFEFLGMVVVDIIGGVVMGALNALMGALDGLIQIITGLVEIVAGVVEAIVKLFSGDLQGAWEAVKKIGNGIVDCFKGLYKATIGVVVDLVKGIIDWFVEMWDVLVGHSIVPDTVNAIIEWFNNLVKTVIEAIAGFVQSIIEWFKNLFETVVRAVTDFVNTVVEWFSNLVETVVDAISDFVESIIDWFVDLYETVVDATADFVESAIDWFANMIETVVDAVCDFVGDVCDWFSDMYDSLSDIIENLFDTVVEWFTDLFDNVVEIVTNMVNSVVEWITDLYNDVVNLIKNFVTKVIEQFKKLKEDAVEKFKAIVEFIKQAWQNVKNVWDVAGTWFGEVWSKIKNAFSNTATWFKDIFQKAWDGICSVFDKTKNYFTNIWNTIKDIFSKVGTAIANGISGAVKGAVNAVLSKAVGLINGFISAINGAISIINAIPGVSIGYIGKLSVPALAKGGIVTSETLARIGEQGKKEAVLPLEQNTGWMDILADKINARGGKNTDNVAPTKIVLQVGETELGYAVIDAINGITKQTGGLKLHMV